MIDFLQMFTISGANGLVKPFGSLKERELNKCPISEIGDWETGDYQP